MLVWSEQFSTGNQAVDKQHQVLFDNVNELEGLLARTNYTRPEMEFILSTVNLLEAYAKEHFKLEEECMDRFSCPAHQENQTAHLHFLAAVEKYQKKCRAAGFRLEVLRELHQFMLGWLQEHIMRIDVQLKPCIAESKSV